MSEPDEPTRSRPDDVARLARAKEIFLAALALGLDEREEFLDRECAGDERVRSLVLMLLRGDQSPLPVESIADGIRAAQEAATLVGPAESQGSMIGRYRLLERIGEGGFGVVFAAEQKEPVKRRVALKVIKLGMDTRQVVARFEAERQALAMMDHPNIAKVFDAGATETGRPYFVMELVRGQAITEYCDTRRLSIRARLELFAMVCDAVQHAHQKGVIHRDIKPSNVLVCEMGEKAVAKVIDFGIAKATEARLTEKTIFTEMRQMIGTPEYMSPEQAGASGLDIDTRTDVYSLGVLLYELLSGTTPFDAKRLRSAAYGEIQRIIREEDPPRPSTKLTTMATMEAVARVRGVEPTRLSSALRGELDWVVMRCLEKDRGRRYDSAGALMRDVLRYVSGEAVQAVPPSAAYRLRKLVRRNKGPVLAGALLALALVAGLVGTSLGFFNAETQRKIAVSQKDRADTKAAEALSAEALATRRAYCANLMSASTAVAGVQFSTARAFLDTAPERLRGWEWRVLDARLDSSIRALTVTDKPSRSTTSELMFHPDGRSFFTINRISDPLAKRWDDETGGLLQSFPQPSQRVGIVISRAFLSDDARRLTIAPEYQPEGPQGIGVNSWDLSTGERTAHSEIASPTNSSVYVIPSADGARVVIYSDQRVWSVRTATGGGGEVLAEHPLKGKTFPLAFNHGDTRIAEVMSSAPYGLVLRDAHSLAPVEVLEWRALVQNVCFSSDDRWLGVAANDNDDTARVWDLSASPPTFITLQHPFQVNNIRFSPDAALVATIAMDHAIRIWDRATGRLLGTYPSESLDPYPLMFMPDGKTVAGWEQDGTIRFWDVTAEGATVLRGHESIVSQAKFAKGNPAGIIVSSSWEGADGSTGTVRLWDADSGDEVGVHRGRLGDIAYAMAVSDDGRFAAIGIADQVGMEKARGGSKDGPIGRTELLDLTTGDLVFAAPLFRVPTWIAFAGDNRSVIVADVPAERWSSVQLHLLDARTGALVRTQELDPMPGWVFARSPDGRTIAALPLTRETTTAKADRPGTMLFLDTQTLETVREINGIPESQRSLAFSLDGSRIASGGEDGLLRIFKADTGERLAEMSGQGMEILTISFSSDGSRIASAGMDRKVRIWDAKTFDQVAAFAGHEGHIGCVDWDADGHRLVSCSGDQTVRIWEPDPIRTRIQAREARRQALVQVEPMVKALFERLGDPERVIAAIEGDASLSPVARRTARQVVLRTGLEAEARATSSPAPR